MFKRVIVATDLFLNSDRLVSHLGGLSDWGAVEIALAHATDFIPQESPRVDAESRNVVHEDRARRLNQELDCQRMVLEKQGFRVSRHLVHGRPQEALDTLAEN